MMILILPLVLIEALEEEAILKAVQALSPIAARCAS